MNILVVGGGGREHALVIKLAESKKTDKIYCAPGKLRDGTSGHTIVYNPKTGIYRGCEGRYRDGCGTCGGCICICDGQSGSVSHDTQMQLSNLADSGKYVGTGKT